MGRINTASWSSLPKPKVHFVSHLLINVDMNVWGRLVPRCRAIRETLTSLHELSDFARQVGVVCRRSCIHCNIHLQAIYGCLNARHSLCCQEKMQSLSWIDRCYWHSDLSRQAGLVSPTYWFGAAARDLDSVENIVSSSLDAGVRVVSWCMLESSRLWGGTEMFAVACDFDIFIDGIRSFWNWLHAWHLVWKLQSTILCMLKYLVLSSETYVGKVQKKLHF